MVSSSRWNKVAGLQLCVLLCTLIISSYASENDNNEDEKQDRKQLDENLVPIFEEFQPEFGLSTDSVSELNNSGTQSSNVTIDDSNNSTSPNNATSSNNATDSVFHCIRGHVEPSVQLVNDTELIKLLVPDSKVPSDRTAVGQCIAVLFYSKNCPFSSMAAPHFNALARAFTSIKLVAINAMHYHLFNTQNGIVGVPTLLLFHNGRAVIRYSGSEYNLEAFINFIARHTDLEPIANAVVTSQDFAGPVVSSPSKESDMFLMLSWLFIIICSCYYFSKSKVCKWMIETVQRNWRESEQHAQHEHLD